MLRSRLVASVLIFLILVGAIFFGLKRSFQGGSSENSRENSRIVAPAFSLLDNQQTSHALSEFRGRPLLLHFWASWCPPCLEEFPNFAEFAAKRKSNLSFVAISEDESWEKANRVLKNLELPRELVVLLDQGGKLPEEYGTFQFPETYLINSKGEILTKFVGPQEWSSPKFQSVLEKFLSKD